MQITVAITMFASIFEVYGNAALLRTWGHDIIFWVLGCTLWRFPAGSGKGFCGGNFTGGTTCRGSKTPPPCRSGFYWSYRPERSSFEGPHEFYMWSSTWEPTKTKWLSLVTSFMGAGRTGNEGLGSVAQADGGVGMLGVASVLPHGNSNRVVCVCVYIYIHTRLDTYQY